MKRSRRVDIDLHIRCLRQSVTLLSFLKSKESAKRRQYATLLLRTEVRAPFHGSRNHRTVGGGIHQIPDCGHVLDAHFENPAFAVGVGVDQ